jgi:hypothetical protein
MGYALVIGDILVSSEEMAEKIAVGDIGRFHRQARSTAKARIAFSKGVVTAGRLTARPRAAAKGPAPPFTPIGIGKPMSLELLGCYTGNVPAKSLFSSKPDLLLISAVKGVQTYEAAPRAINQLVKGISDRQYLEPSALSEGAPIVYSTRSLVNSTLLFAVEVIAETFDKKIFDGIQRLFSTAAGLPIFAPAGAYLMAGSFLTRIFGDLGKALLESPPFLKAGFTLRLDTPEFAEALASMVVIYNDRDQGQFADYKAGMAPSGPGRRRMALVHRDTGKEYRGDAPYAILSLDGRPRPELDDFAPRLASAAVLERFYGSQDVGGQLIDTLCSAMELYNDFSFRQKAEKIKKQMSAYDPGSDEYKASQTLLDAYVRNIRQEVLRP